MSDFSFKALQEVAKTADHEVTYLIAVEIAGDPVDGSPYPTGDLDPDPDSDGSRIYNHLIKLTRHEYRTLCHSS